MILHVTIVHLNLPFEGKNLLRKPALSTPKVAKREWLLGENMKLETCLDFFIQNQYLRANCWPGKRLIVLSHRNQETVPRGDTDSETPPQRRLSRRVHRPPLISPSPECGTGIDPTTLNTTNSNKLAHASDTVPTWHHRGRSGAAGLG